MAKGRANRISNILPITCGLSFIACGACTNSSNLPAKCVISKDYVAISRNESESYVFDQIGITFHVSQASYKLSWPVIRELYVVRSVDLRLEDGVQKVKKAEIALRVVPQKVTVLGNTNIGAVEPACWNALVDFMEDRKIDAHINMNLQSSSNILVP
jgi:hypothetical protein